jgi:hypothetical protein
MTTLELLAMVVVWLRDLPWWEIVKIVAAICGLLAVLTIYVRVKDTNARAKAISPSEIVQIAEKVRRTEYAVSRIEATLELI